MFSDKYTMTAFIDGWFECYKPSPSSSTLTISLVSLRKIYQHTEGPWRSQTTVRLARSLVGMWVGNTSAALTAGYRRTSQVRCHSLTSSLHLQAEWKVSFAYSFLGGSVFFACSWGYWGFVFLATWRNYGAEQYGPGSVCLYQKSAFVMEQCTKRMTYPDWGSGCYKVIL